MNIETRGVVYVASFVVLANANAVFAGHLLQTVNTFTLLFWSFLIATAFFMVLFVSTKGAAALALKKDAIGPVIAVNITGLFMWLGYYNALRLIEPAIATAIMSGIGPCVIIAYGFFALKEPIRKDLSLAALGIFLGALFLGWTSLSGNSGLSMVSLPAAVLGLACAVGGGTFQALTTVFTKKLGALGWTANQVMAHRSYLLILVSLVFALQGPGLSVASQNQVLGIAVATVFGVTLSLWILQKGILLVPAFKVTSIISLAPIATLTFQLLDDRISWSNASAVGCLIVVVFTIYTMKLKL